MYPKGISFNFERRSTGQSSSTTVSTARNRQQSDESYRVMISPWSWCESCYGIAAFELGGKAESRAIAGRCGFVGTRSGGHGFRYPVGLFFCSHRVCWSAGWLWPCVRSRPWDRCVSSTLLPPSHYRTTGKYANEVISQH